LRKSNSHETIPGGFRWRFDETSGLLNDVASVIDAERRCCPFLRFVVTVEPGDGPVWIEVTGPAGAQEFLRSVLFAVPPASSTAD
jgi:hypothetical protein